MVHSVLRDRAVCPTAYCAWVVPCFCKDHIQLGQALSISILLLGIKTVKLDPTWVPVHQAVTWGVLLCTRRELLSELLNFLACLGDCITQTLAIRFPDSQQAALKCEAAAFWCSPLSKDLDPFLTFNHHLPIWVYKAPLRNNQPPVP